jgi:pyruvate kinase/choline kinase
MEDHQTGQGESSLDFIGTIGPKVANPKTLHALSAAGMKIARINGSHGSLDDVRHLIRTVRSHLGQATSILLDLPGNKIRTNNLSTPVALRAGETFVLKPENLTFRALHSKLGPGDRISAADGAIQLVVTGIKDTDIVTEVLVGGELANRKGINIRGIHGTIPFDFERDIALIDIAIEESVDLLGLSFVRSSEQVRRIKAQLIATGIRVVAKIETAEAVQDLDLVLAEAHMIMVDRGDLEADVGRENVPLITRRILKRANEVGIPAIVASQFLCSMLDKALPFMAEVSDISHTVLDGADILMLSEETAIGQYPELAMATLVRTAKAARSSMSNDYQALILAAGDSKGFGGLTTNKHKCMLDVGGTTIIQHQLDNLRRAGIEDDRVLVVTGHNHRQVEAYLRGEGFRGSFVYNPWYTSTNILTSIWMARPAGPTILLYGDIIFEPSILTDLLACKGDVVLAVDEASPKTPEDEKISIRDGLIYRGSKDLDPSDADGEFIGLAKLTAKGTQLLMTEMESVVRSGHLMEFLTVTFETLHRKGLSIRPCYLSGRAWNDNDTLTDLERSRDDVYAKILKAAKKS